MYSLGDIKKSNIFNAIKVKTSLSYPYLSHSHLFFCSFQKSGRTWVRFLLGNYLNKFYNFNLDVTLLNLFSILPPLNDKKLIKSSFKLFRKNNLPLIFFTHSRFNKYLFNTKKIVFMHRSIYDTMVSFFFHNSQHHKKFDGDIKEFIRDEKFGIKKLINYINSWSSYIIDSKNRTHTISYENLSNDTNYEFLCLLKFLNIPVNKSILDLCIEESRFEKMKKVELKSGIANHVYDKSSKNARRVRSGKIGEYSKYLDSEDIKYIYSECNKFLSLKSKELVNFN